MNNAIRWGIPLAAIVVFGGALLGAKRDPYNAPPVADKSSDAVAKNYPAPEVEIMTRPMEATVWSKSKRKHHKKRPKAEPKVDPAVDADMGVMAADDPALSKSGETKKESNDDYKDWAAPGKGN